MAQQNISLKKVRVHNLKSVDLELEPNQLIVFSGVSGSGKSSLAFDTLYAEGQRRYVESLSTFARRQMGEMSRPELEHAEGISPTISIEQKTAGRNPRSTVGTMTEIYDYLRVLYARVATPHCPVSGEPVSPQSRERIIREVQSLPEESKLVILAPYARGKKAEFKEDFQELLRKGFVRARVDGEIISLADGIALDGNVAHNVDVVIDRLAIQKANHSRIAEALTQALELGQGVCSVVDADTREERLFSMHAYSPQSGISYDALEPHDFSFNSPGGMCPRCNGMGWVQEFNLDKIIDPNLSIAENCCSVGSGYETVYYGNIYDNLAKTYRFSVETPWKDLSSTAKRVFLYGTPKGARMRFVSKNGESVWHDYVHWKGVLEEAHSRYREAKSDSYRGRLEQLMSEQVCSECQGSRLKPYPAAARLAGVGISSLSALTVADCAAFFERLQLSEQDQLIADELLKEIRQRLRFLLDVGLHYLTLDRTAPTLSGGEAQRVRLASQIGCGLVGITYILDEPSIGLHPRDNAKLIHTLKALRDKGNTVIVVEHDAETMWEADHIVDFGPGAGVQGGHILCSGKLKDLLPNKKSITAAYLTGRKEIAVPKKRRAGTGEILEIRGARHHNLKNVDVQIPLGVFIAITGVSGSGKSSLISETLYPALCNTLQGGELPIGECKSIEGIDHLDKVIAIDQSPIGRNPRSNPATYIKLFDDIRDLFTELPESRARGYKAGRFSFNVKEGTCSRCFGLGMVKIDMDFLEPAWIECPACNGRRFDYETLSVLYKGKSIYDVLEMDVAQALEFFQNIPYIRHKLETLQCVGMDYIKLGQSSTTLSGGEAQRIKLAKELVRPATGKTMYIFDEPTTGLHFHDINQLLAVLHAFVDRGNTVLVIEHNMDVVKTADWIIDLGPEGGAGGGQVIANGNPEQIALMATPTGTAVRETLEHNAQKKMMEVLNRPPRPRSAQCDCTHIVIRGAEQNNLQCLDLEIPRNKLTICTGPSGSGKTSLAFDTIYAEGQRRYIESLSPYARQFVKQMPKPKVGQIEGLSPAIAIEQKTHAGNPRSTVGTMTEVYDYLRLLFARLGIAHCPETGEVIKAISKEHVVDRILALPTGEKLHLLAPLEVRKNETFTDVIQRYQRQGFLRIRLNQQLYDIDQQELPFDRRKKNALFLVVDRIKVEDAARMRLLEAVENASGIGGGKLTILREDGSDLFFNLTFAVESTGRSYPEITPHTFSFNTPEGMCSDCEGLGFQYGANLSRNALIMGCSITQLMMLLCKERLNPSAFDFIRSIFNQEGVHLSIPLKMLPSPHLNLVLNGSPPGKWYTLKNGLKIQWQGINRVLAKVAKSASRDLRQQVIPLLDEHECPHCQGSRLNALARAVTIKKASLADICRWPLEQSLQFIKSVSVPKSEGKVLQEVKQQLVNRLGFLDEVGLSYLALNRRAPTLSGGEAQRIRLARQLGSGLTGVLYVLDEPTIGLHPRDNHRLNQALDRLQKLGNTLIMVEHDPMTIQTADYLLDFGPASGRHGGHVTAQGTLKQIQRSATSLTGAYLSGKKTIPYPAKRRKPSKDKITVRNACAHNLKALDVDIPLGLMVALTGVSGSGKSTLLHQVVLPAVERNIGRPSPVTIEGTQISGMHHISKVVAVDQNPIGRTSRSDIATYLDVLTPLRHLFSALPLAKATGLQPKNFSYNHRKGMCTTCWGLGYRKIEMHFLPDVRIVCHECQGLRLNPLSLQVLYHEKNLGQWLQCTVEELALVFANHRSIKRPLDTLISVGLGYLKLNQEMVSLSGGEAQRIKLSRDLAKRSSGPTLYLIDEPTTGLHSEDIQKLLLVLHRLVDNGHSVVYIEHQADMILNADYVIDLGPDAGEKGGEIVCQGTPEQIMDSTESYTGKFLKKR